MGNRQGWIRLHRQIMETPEWLAEPFTRGQAWVDLLLLANHETGFVRKRGILIAVDRGQVGYSEDSLSSRWQWSRGKVRRFLLELTRLCRISRKISEKTIPKKTSVSNLINIINYDKYQMNGTEDGTEDGRKTIQEQRMKRMKRIFLSDSIEIRLSVLLLDKIISRNPGFKKPDIQLWAKDIDLMIRLDSRTLEEILRVIEWSQSDPFWQNNILSTAKLRKQFDQLVLKMGPAPDHHDDTRTVQAVTCPACNRTVLTSDMAGAVCVLCTGTEVQPHV